MTMKVVMMHLTKEMSQVLGLKVNTWEFPVFLRNGVDVLHSGQIIVLQKC